MATSQQQNQQSINQFNDELEKINQRIIDLGGDLGENLVEKFTKAVTEAKKIKNPLSEVESISKKISEAADDRVLLENKLKILSLDYSKAARQGNEEEIRKLLTKKLQLKAALDLNDSLQQEYQKLLDTSKEEKKITEEKKKQNEFLDLTKKKLVGIKDSLTDMLKIGSIFDLILKGITRANEISVDLSKNFGYGAVKADTMVMEMQAMALASDNTNMTLKNIGEAMNQLGTTTGFFAKHSADTLETQIMLTKQLGLSGEEAAHIYEMSVLTGKSSSKVNDEMLGAFVNARNTAKVGVSMKQVFAEAAKVSGQLQATFAGNPAKITEAIVKVKALGTTLEQTKSQGDKLLDFASSLESELQAELLTGKQLNLERARAAALAGDQVALAEELNKNIGTYDDFSKMNVLQQQSLAEAVGLTADQLAEQLKKQKLAQESGKSLAQITKEEAEAAEKRKTIQEKFNNIVEKLQDVIGSIGTILSPVVELFTFLADHSYLIYTYLGIMLIAKLPTVVSGFKSMAGSVMDMAKNLKGNVMKLFSKEGRDSLLSGGDKVKETAEKTTEAGGKAGAGGKGAGEGIKSTLKGISAGIQSFSKVKLADIGKLFLASLALVALTPAIPALLLLQLVNGKLIQGALTGLGLGLKAIGNALSSPKIMIGVAIATLAIMGLGKALGYAAPIVEAFGKVITAVFEGIATVITAASDGVVKMFTALESVDVGKLLAIGPALFGIGAGIAALGGGSAMGAIGGFVGGAISSVGSFLGISEKSKGPIDTLMAIASVADPIQRAASSIQSMTSSIGELSSVLATIDTSKLEALGNFSEKMSAGSAVKGITDFITAPVKAIGGMIEGSTGGGGNDNTAMITAINEVRDAVNKLYSKDQSIHMDGKTVGTTLSQGTYKSA